jgi:phosphohistidine swiveling domain-containing protein
MSLTGESVNFEKTGYIQIIVGIPFIVGMQKEAVNTILNIVDYDLIIRDIQQGKMFVQSEITLNMFID